MFSVIYYQLFRTGSFRIPRYLELIFLSLYLKSSPFFRTCQKQCTYVVVQFYPCFKFYFLLFLGIVIYDNEFETKEKKIETKYKIEPQHVHKSTAGNVLHFI